MQKNVNKRLTVISQPQHKSLSDAGSWRCSCLLASPNGQLWPPGKIWHADVLRKREQLRVDGLVHFDISQFNARIQALRVGNKPFLEL